MGRNKGTKKKQKDTSVFKIAGSKVAKTKMATQKVKTNLKKVGWGRVGEGREFIFSLIISINELR